MATMRRTTSVVSGKDDSSSSPAVAADTTASSSTSAPTNSNASTAINTSTITSTTPMTILNGSGNGPYNNNYSPFVSPKTAMTALLVAVLVGAVALSTSQLWSLTSTEELLFVADSSGRSQYQNLYHDALVGGGGGGRNGGGTPLFVSVVILTYKKHQLLAHLLKSLRAQETLPQFSYETIVVDNGCLSETAQVVTEHERLLAQQDKKTNGNKRLHYFPLCDNPGYAMGNNRGVFESSSPHTPWILFLNDDVVLQTPHFLRHYYNLATASSKHKDTNNKLAAIGCQILNQNGTAVIESGSIVFKDASCLGFGRGRNPNEAAYGKLPVANELQHARVVDYVSGACLMVQRHVFTGYGGFNGKQFPNYYEDTDLQLHIQHELHKEVWLEPRAVVWHAEHGSFGGEDAARKMQKASQVFLQKWQPFLWSHHVVHPLKSRAMKRAPPVYGQVATFRAANVRARSRPTVLFIVSSYEDIVVTNSNNQFNDQRATRNYNMLQTLAQELELFVTVAALSPSSTTTTTTSNAAPGAAAGGAAAAAASGQANANGGSGGLCPDTTTMEMSTVNNKNKRQRRRKSNSFGSTSKEQACMQLRLWGMEVANTQSPEQVQDFWQKHRPGFYHIVIVSHLTRNLQLYPPVHGIVQQAKKRTTSEHPHASVSSAMSLLVIYDLANSAPDTKADLKVVATLADAILTDSQFTLSHLQPRLVLPPPQQSPPVHVMGSENFEQQKSVWSLLLSTSAAQ